MIVFVGELGRAADEEIISLKDDEVDEGDDVDMIDELDGLYAPGTEEDWGIDDIVEPAVGVQLEPGPGVQDAIVCRQGKTCGKAKKVNRGKQKA